MTSDKAQIVCISLSRFTQKTFTKTVYQLVSLGMVIDADDSNIDSIISGLVGFDHFKCEGDVIIANVVNGTISIVTSEYIDQSSFDKVFAETPDKFVEMVSCVLPSFPKECIIGRYTFVQCSDFDEVMRNFTKDYTIRFNRNGCSDLTMRMFLNSLVSYGFVDSKYEAIGSKRIDRFLDSDKDIVITHKSSNDRRVMWLTGTAFDKNYPDKICDKMQAVYNIVNNGDTISVELCYERNGSEIDEKIESIRELRANINKAMMELSEIKKRSFV